MAVLCLVTCPNCKTEGPDMIDVRVALEAKAAGYDAWLVFDVDETLLSKGCFTEAQEE